MKYSFTLCALAALTSHATFCTAMTLPVRAAAPGSFTIDINRREPVPYSLRRRGNATPKGVSVPNGGADWYANATAGGQNVDVLLDTGSADLWLVAPGDDASVTQGVQTYDPKKSGKAMQGATFNIGYGQGGNGVSGPVYTDKFCIGEACVDNMAIGSATKDTGLGNFPRSGIIGLAFQGGNSIRPNQQKTFMEMLEPQLKEPIMAFQLAPPGKQSTLTFGSVDPNSYVAPLQKITADSGSKAKYANSWSFENVGYFKNGKQIGTFDIVFDTGAPHTTGPEAVVRAYYNGIPGAKDVHGDATEWTVPCGTKLPDLTLKLGSAVLILPGKALYNGAGEKTSGTCDVWFIKENSDVRGAVGDSFFAQHVVIFNQKDSTISWGNQKQSGL